MPEYHEVEALLFRKSHFLKPGFEHQFYRMEQYFLKEKLKVYPK
jgi:hypothetical protein